MYCICQGLAGIDPIDRPDCLRILEARGGRGRNLFILLTPSIDYDYTGVVPSLIQVFPLIIHAYSNVNDNRDTYRT